jgi:hypothetical protein
MLRHFVPPTGQPSIGRRTTRGAHQG